MAKWQGTVVPNTGYVEKVYFNTNLSINEVVNILNNVDYTENEPTIYQTYPVIANSIMAILYVENFGDETINIEITSGEFAGNIFNTESGWNEDFNGIIEFDNEAVSQIDGGVWGESDLINVGTQNNLLTELFSITPFTQSQQTTADKLQKLIDGKQYVIDKTNSKAGTSLNIKSKWKDIGDVIEGIESGGSALIKGDWKGTVVPNSGYVENVYVNTSLSNEEVLELITPLTYDDDGMCIVIMDEGTSSICIMDGMFICDFYALMSGDTSKVYWVSPNADQEVITQLGFTGWKPSFNGIHEFNSTAVSLSLNQNNLLTNLFSITPFVQSTLTLEGEYDGSTLTITELPSGEGTVVPNSGYVENVYFNTDLSVEEVVSLLRANWGELGCLYLMANNEGSAAIVAMEEDGIVGIALVINGDFALIFSDSPEMNGWNPNITFPLEVNIECVSAIESSPFPVGEQNYKLTSLFSTTPFTQSNAIDIKSLIENDKRIPLQIKLEGIGGVAIVVPSVSNLVVSDKGVASWEAPVLSLPSGYQYSLEYIISVNNEELTPITETSKNITGYLIEGENIVSVVVKATITIKGNESIITHEFSLPSYSIILINTTLPTKLRTMGVATIGTNVYLFGGNIGGAGTNIIYKFDSTNESISTLTTTLPNKIMYGMGVATIGTNVYIFGGNNLGTLYKNIYKFDTNTEILTTLDTTLPTKLSEMGSATIDTNVYIFGGQSSSGFSNIIYKFDTTNESISTLDTTLPISYMGMVIATIGTNVYLFGGTNAQYQNKIYKFDSTNETISNISALPTILYNMAIATIDTNVYIFGGEGSTGGKENKIYKFDANTEILTTLDTTLPEEMGYMGSATIGTNVYLFGGSKSSGITNEIYKFLG